MYLLSVWQRFMAPAWQPALLPSPRPAGMGNTGPPNCRRFDIARFTDGLQAYGPLAAKKYGADYQLVAWSGAGLNHYRQL